MNIGVAKPTPEELSAVPHHFINSHSVHDNVTAALFEKYAQEAAEKIFQKNNTVIIAGGTGLYIRAFCEGLDQIPVIDEEIRSELTKQYQSQGIEWLAEELRKHDPVFAQQGEMQNPHRMLRALEVKLSTGRSIRDFHQRQKKHHNFQIIKICIELPREKLYSRINNRVDDMMHEGLEEEARDLWPFQHLNALQTVGYTELFDHFSGKTSLNEAVLLIKQHTRNYAKRQLTWFKKEEEIAFAPPSGSDIISLAEKKLTGKMT